jgi:hypothetical protein
MEAACSFKDDDHNLQGTDKAEPHAPPFWRDSQSGKVFRMPPGIWLGMAGRLRLSLPFPLLLCLSNDYHS